MNLHKIFLILRREYLTRVRKKSFIIMTILGPLLMGSVIVVPYFMSRVSDEKRNIAVLDESHLFTDKFKSDRFTNFFYVTGQLDSLRKSSSDENISDILYIPATEDINALAKGVMLYSTNQPSLNIVERIERTIEHEITSAKYAAANINEKVLASIRETDVSINTRDMENKKTSSGFTTGIGFIAGFLIYMFIFIYGAQVMRGVMEEKTSRIVEVIISSVKPFELMLGKIIGVALVGLTQFLLWIVLTAGIYTTVSATLFRDETTEAKVERMIQSRAPATSQMLEHDSSAVVQSNNWASEVTDAMSTINFPLILGMFLFYFLGGYLLYSALFAAIGAAVDSETDTQQFMLPITIPLIVSFIMVQYVILNPEGSIAFWFSMIPFTSPIIMMVRIPFGVSAWEVALSMACLVAGFIFTTWLAGRIYRTGILMYGKKVNYRELARWLFYKG